MTNKTKPDDFSSAAFDDRAREFAFWSGVIGLVVSGLIYLSIYLSGDLILHYRISSPLYGLFFGIMVLSAYFKFRVKMGTNFSVTAIFFLFWSSSYAEAFQDHLTFVSMPLVLFVPVLLMMVLHHKLVLALVSSQFVLVLHYTYTYGVVDLAPTWSRTEQLHLSITLAGLSALSVIAVAIVSRQRARTDKALQTLVADQIELATTDALTGLPNRRAFTEHLSKMHQGLQGTSHNLKVGLIDLDGFKSINDVYGHFAGDELLIQAAKRLYNNLPDGAFFARLGGDEFGICFYSDPHETDHLGDRLCAFLREPFQLKEGLVRIGASAGFTTARPTDQSVSPLLERADYALYKSKSDAKGQASLFSDNDENQVARDREIKRYLLSDGLLNELDVVFQPIVYPETGTVKAMETLVRWNNYALGSIPPSEFIPIAERIGRISEISCFVLRRGLEVARQWPDNIFLSMNLSAVDLSSTSSVNQLISILEKSTVPAERVVLEITETTLMANLKKGGEHLQAFRDLGVKIALDDFGTGYSSLSYLKQFAIKKLKIDRSFISDIETDELARNLLNGIIELCARIGINCVVEGVETEDQLKIVAAHKNALAQGFYFSRPLPDSDTLAYIARSNKTDLRLIA